MKTCNLTLRIDGTVYFLKSLGDGAWELRKRDKTTYVVHATYGHYECECPDCVFRGHQCKHIKALLNLGVIHEHQLV